MASKRAVSDGVDLLDNGQVLLRMNGAEWQLRRPKIGELRAFYERMKEVLDAQSGTEDRWEAIRAGEALADYWQEVVNVLRGDDDGEFPSDFDDLPVWLLSAELMVKVENHWREVPYLSGG